MMNRLLPSQAIARWSGFLVLVSIMTAGCISKRVVVDSYDVSTLPRLRQIQSPVKAHLLDGSSWIVDAGATIMGDSLSGFGSHYDIQLQRHPKTRFQVPLDSVAALEGFRADVNAGATLFMTLAGVGMAAVIVPAAAVAIFGSCPTVYTISEDGTAHLQGESFPHSIAALFERRDVDLIEQTGTKPPIIEIRNEALETHYINHALLQYADHHPNESVLPIRGDQPHLILKSGVRPHSAHSKNGDNVIESLLPGEEKHYRTPDEVLNAVSLQDVTDHIDIEFEVESPGPYVLSLRSRNTLLTTYMLYERMLSSRGVGAVDWLNNDLNSIDNAIQMGDYFSRIMTMKVHVKRDGIWKQVATVGNAGPIAWERTGVVLPDLDAPGKLEIRLEFIADGWLVDDISIHQDRGVIDLNEAPVERMDVESPDPSAIANVIDSPDESYLEMRPGSFVRFYFSDPTLASEMERTWLWSAQGYYTEWIRGEWARESDPESVFYPNEEGTMSILQRWPERRKEYEERFYSSKIPVN